MTTYKILKGGIENKEYGVLRDTGDGTITSIPFDPANTDYQTYLKWLDDGNVPLSSEEGNTPEPADQGAQE